MIRVAWIEVVLPNMPLPLPLPLPFASLTVAIQSLSGKGMHDKRVYNVTEIICARHKTAKCMKKCKLCRKL
jgi:hypothetical protein